MDKYDEAIAYLEKHPDEIEAAWQAPYTHRAGCLFVHTASTQNWTGDQRICGCLTQIRDAYFRENGVLHRMHIVGPTTALTHAIGKDGRIPRRPEYIEVSDLPIFAEWQRLLNEAGYG